MSSDSGAFYSSRLRPARLVTYLEALETAEEEPHVDHFSVLPPRDGDVGDLEDVPDDLENEDGFEAAGEFEVGYGSDEESESGDVDPNPEPSRKRVCGQDIPRWRKRASFDVPLDDSGLQTYLEEEFPYLPTQSPFRIWSEIFPPSLVDHIVEQTTLYAHRDCNFPAFSTSREDISSFLGVLLLSGYHHLPEEDHYWSNCEDLGVPIISKAMSRASFRNIKRHIHFADNHNLEQGNKIAKIAPVYTSVNATLAKFGVFHEDLSIDESMVPYFGRHSAKMFIRGKPIRFGYKLWSLCGSDGYPYHLQVYKGKEATSSNEPLGTRVVNHMVEVVRENSDVAKHHFFFDNFFTSYKLLSDLASEKVKATGTVRENRTGGANRDLTSTKEMKKSTPGTFDFRCDGTVFMCKWNDNSVVTVASNCQTHTPVHEVRRRVKGQPVNNVQQPHLIHAYNQGMGGVDLMDRMLASYRPSIRWKKWYWPLFTNALNVTVVASWRIHCKIAESLMSHLDFRREIAICLLKMSMVSRLQVGSGPRVNLPDDVRFDGEDHEKVAATQGRCNVCKKNCRYMCAKCNVRLHYDRGSRCHVTYHMRSGESQ